MSHGDSPTTPIDIARLDLELKGHPDRGFVNTLLNGLREGFHTGISHFPTESFECKNLQSAIRDPQFVTTALISEVSKGYLIGPFDTPPFPVYRVNPIGVATGKYSGKKRIIVDLSAPHENPNHDSLNQLIDKEDFSLSYVRIDDAIDAIKSAGRGAWLNKTDIVDAFKLIPVRRDLWPFYGVKWQGKYYFYCRLAFGSRSSPKLFDYLSQAVCWIAKNNYAISCILHLLDDFLTVDKPTMQPDRTMALLTLIFGRLKIPLSLSKTVGPATELEYLGIVIDSVRMEARLPQDKLSRVRELLHEFENCKTCTKQQLLSLLGHLQFASRIVLPGRSFVSYLIRLSTSVKHLYHHVTLTKECRRDIKMWQVFLQSWNGVSMFLEDKVTDVDDLDMGSAASDIGFAGYFEGKWFQSRWPDDLPIDATRGAHSRCFMELYPIVICALLWDGAWRGKRINFHCVHLDTVEIIRKGRTKSAAIMGLMRALTYRAAMGSYFVTATWLPSADNGICCALSRFEQKRFWHLAGPHTAPQPCQCPHATDVMLF